MKGMLSRYLLAACALSSAACSAPKSMSRTVGGSGELPLLTVGVRRLPGCPVQVPKDFEVSGRMNSQGHVDVQIPVRNPSSSPKRFRYSWQWVGPNGVSTTDPAREVWRTGFLDARDITRVGSTSTVADPSAVVLRISSCP